MTKEKKTWSSVGVHYNDLDDMPLVASEVYGRAHALSRQLIGAYQRRYVRGRFLSHPKGVMVYGADIDEPRRAVTDIMALAGSQAVHLMENNGVFDSLQRTRLFDVRRPRQFMRETRRTGDTAVYLSSSIANEGSTIRVLSPGLMVGRRTLDHFILEVRYPDPEAKYPNTYLEKMPDEVGTVLTEARDVLSATAKELLPIDLPLI